MESFHILVSMVTASPSVDPSHFTFPPCFNVVLNLNLDFFLCLFLDVPIRRSSMLICGAFLPWEQLWTQHVLSNTCTQNCPGVRTVCAFTGSFVWWRQLLQIPHTCTHISCWIFTVNSNISSSLTVLNECYLDEKTKLIQHVWQVMTQEDTNQTIYP